MRKFLFVAFMALALIGTSTGMARAAEPKLIAEHARWRAYVLDDKGGLVCYMISDPARKDGKVPRRGYAHALVTHRPGEESWNVFSYIAGYDYKNGAPVTAVIDGVSFKLFSQEDMAWAPDSATDDKLVEALKRGSEMVVKGISSKGTETKDTYSLKGATAAYRDISGKCGKK